MVIKLYASMIQLLLSIVISVRHTPADTLQQLDIHSHPYWLYLLFNFKKFKFTLNLVTLKF